MPPRDVWDCNLIYQPSFCYHYHELMERILNVEFIQLHPGIESSEGYEDEEEEVPDLETIPGGGGDIDGDDQEVESLSDDDDGIIDLTDPDVLAVIMAHTVADVRPIDG